ncbi:MAG: hypothetical protein IT215_09220 [Chitinophagaceae bacterium]|nr:hypothetical protein [Chitinophagaceae bacterium]
MLNKIFILITLFWLIIFYSCDCECENEDCRVDVNNQTIQVVSNVQGRRGTYISPDSILNITRTGAIVTLKIFSISPCHNIIGYGHIWSTSPNATFESLIRDFNYKDYGEIDKSIFDKNLSIGSYMTNLLPNTVYYVKSWIVIDVTHLDCSIERQIIYNNEIKFRTL